MEELVMVAEIMNMIYYPVDVYFFSIIFFFVSSYLRTLTISVILILTIGKILDLMKRKFYLALKWIIYIWFFGYSVYSLGIFSNLAELNTLDWSTFAFSVLAPVSMLIVGKQIGSMKIKGHKIFIYYVIMILYLLLAILWYTYYPEQIIFTVLFIYWCIALFFVTILNYLKGG